MSASIDSETDRSKLIERVERVDLRVQDIDRALGFYRDVVGLEVADRRQGYASLRAGGGTEVLTLSSTGVDAPADRRSTGLFHTAIRYPDRHALADALVRLADAGYRIGAGDHGVSEAIYVDDPDGNGIELYRDRPRDEWPAPGPGEKVRMYTAPVDLDDLAGETNSKDALQAGAPNGTEIGHVHLQVSDLARTNDFYANALGLDLMTRLGDQAAFFSSHDYHHHLGANTWNSRGQRPAARNRAGLDRVIFRVESRAELEEAHDRLASYGTEVTGDDGELVVFDPDDIELRFVVRS